MPMLSLQVSQELYDQFEAVKDQAEYSSKSEALREAITMFINQHTKVSNFEGHMICTLSITYPIREDALNILSETEMNFSNLVQTSMDLRLVERGVKVFVLSGEGAEIQDFFKIFAGNRFYKVFLNQIVFD